MSETAIMLGVISVPIIFILIANKFDLFSLNDYPIVEYILYFMSAWFVVPILAIAVKINEINSYGLTNSLGGLYKAMLTIMILLTTFMLLGLIIFGLKSIGDAAK